MAESTAPTLPCKQCGYVNEPERVYCHNCGTKLDRSVLPKEDEVRRETPEKARRRIHKMTNPDKGILKRELKAFVQTIFWALVVALLVVILRQPDGVPPVQKGVLPRMIASDLGDAIDSPQPRSLALGQDEINAFLKSSIHEAKDASFLGGIIEFKRAYVVLTPGVCHIGVEKSLWGWPVFLGTNYRLAVQNEQFMATNIGGNLGRLSIHPLVMHACEYLFTGLWAALHREEQQMHELRSVQIDNGRITLITKGAAKH